MSSNQNHNGESENVCYRTFGSDLFRNVWEDAWTVVYTGRIDVLHHALITLMIEKGYEVITVQDIIDRANVGRSTFYTHYTGKQDLLMRGLKDLSRNLREHQRVALGKKGAFPDRGFGFSLAFFEHVDSHRNVYHAIVERQSGTVVFSELR